MYLIKLQLFKETYESQICHALITEYVSQLKYVQQVFVNVLFAFSHFLRSLA